MKGLARFRQGEAPSDRSCSEGGSPYQGRAWAFSDSQSPYNLVGAAVNPGNLSTAPFTPSALVGETDEGLCVPCLRDSPTHLLDK